MEKINGVSFEEYAAACGNLAQGMPESQVLEVLQLEKPVWDATMDQWNNKLGELMTSDMSYATKYGELFSNPKAGRFASAANTGVSIEEILPLVPDFDSYQKIFWHQSVASEHGIDPVGVIESYGIDMGKWGSLNMHYGKYQNDLLDYQRPDYAEKFAYFQQIQDRWRNHFEEVYKNEKADLSSDINF